MAFIEAIRQIGLEKNPEDVIYIHVTLLPYITGSNEVKSKPTQHSVKQLQSLGIQPDLLVCRSDIQIPEEIKNKLALFCNVRKECVIANLTADNLYDIPLMLEEQGLAIQTCKKLQLKNIEPKNDEWIKITQKIKKEKNKEITIAIVGKYVKLEDCYLSIAESLHHAGIENNVKVNIKYIDCEPITKENANKILNNIDGIIIPGGFGKRGTEGKINTIQYARENKIPFLGICLGMQMAVVEYARNVLNLKDANSEEFDEKSGNKVIHIMDEQKNINNKGGTMRLGKYPCLIKNGTLANEIYKEEIIEERHRHRYEYNNDYRQALEKAGLICSGTSPNGNLVEIVEIKEHPFFIAVQFHPEFKSRPNRPAPLFRQLVRVCKEK